MNSMPIRVAILGLAFALMAGCASAPQHGDQSWAPALPRVPDASPPADGAIWHDGQDMQIFSDPKARRVGDIITIVLAETMQASKKQSTTTAKKDSESMAAPTILGHTSPLATTLSGDRSFSGQGSSSQSNQLTGEITVTVAQRLTNGNLVIRGEKWLTINQGRELVRISGIVRPQDIGPDNTVLSTRVADANITYTGSGELADANAQGWLGRFFNSKWWPF